MGASAFRLERQHLNGRDGADVVEVARRLCGLHAQVMSSADLILWARVRGHRPGALDAALRGERSLVKTWLMRGTLHLVPADDLPLYVGALDNRGVQRRMAARVRDHGAGDGAADRGIGEALDGRCLTRAELVEAVGPAPGAEVLRSGWGDLLKPAARRGLLCFGPNRGRNVTSSGPTGGLPAGRRRPGGRRRGRSCCAGSSPPTARRRRTTSSAGSASPGARRRRGRRSRQRSRRCSGGRSSSRATGMPRVSATVVARGRVVGVWAHERRGRRLAVRVEPFAPLGERTRAAVAREAKALARHLGGELELSGIESAAPT